MKVVLVLIVLCLVCVLPAFGQSTTVSASVTDQAGQAWFNGTYSLTFQVSPSNPTSQYFWNGAPFSKTQTIAGNLDGSGHFSVSVPSNTSITPSGSTWIVEVCPIAKGNTPCYSTHGLTITGATQNISSSVIPPAISIDLAHPAYPFVVAYSNAEISTAPVGALYWDYTLSHYFVCQTTNGSQIWYGGCTLWKELCLVGDGLCGGSGLSESFQHNNTLVGTQPIFNIIDSGTVTATMTNDIANNRVNVSFAAASGTGCTVGALLDQWVLSIHPDHTCYGSTNFTWDDGVNRQNWQAGIGNIFSPDLLGNQGQLFSFGQNISSAGGSIFAVGNGTFAGSQIFALGTTLSVSQAGSVASASPAKIWLFGISDQVNYAGTGSGAKFLTNVHILGDSTTATAQGNNPEMRDIYSVGVSNTFLSDGTGSSGATVTDEEDTFVLGEGNEASATNGAVTSKIYMVGDGNSTDDTGTNSSSDITHLGANNSASASGNTNLSQASTLGHGNTVQSTSVSSSNMVAAGHNNTLSDCSDCFVFGKGINLSTSNEIGIGFSNPPELIITPGHVNIKAIPAAPTLCNLGGNISGIGAATPQVIITCAATAPSSGCPCRAFVSWTILGGGTSSTQQVEGIINDGTSNFAGTAGNIDNQITTGFKGIARSDYSPNLYSNSQAATFTLTGESDHTWSAVTASFYLGAPTQIRVTYLSSN